MNILDFRSFVQQYQVDAMIIRIKPWGMVDLTVCSPLKAALSLY